MLSQEVPQLASQRLVERLLRRNGLKASDLPFFSKADQVNAPGQKQFSSYDYLDLKTHPLVLHAASEALKEYGLSTSASRLMAGELPHHAWLEAQLADVYGQESALVFVSGHATNVSTIAALVEHGDLVIVDQYSHNSIQMGVKLSGARRLVFPHNDPAGLERLLVKHRRQYRRCLIVTEGHFSMDGDSPDIHSLLMLRDQHQAWLMVDEAHGLGVLGAGGLGSHQQHILILILHTHTHTHTRTQTHTHTQTQPHPPLLLLLLSSSVSLSPVVPGSQWRLSNPHRHPHTKIATHTMTRKGKRRI